jgi:DNA-binding NarL/FixJ family response regulator
MKRQELIDSLPTKQIAVLLADDHTTFRRSLKVMVELDGDIEVVGEAKNGGEAVRLAMRLHPQVIVMDIAMPVLNGLDATRQILEASPTTRVVVLSAHPDPEYIKQAVLCGASGYLIKQSSTQVLAQAIREVLEGNSFFCAPIAKPLRDHCRKLFVKTDLLKRKAAHLALSGEASAFHEAFKEKHGRFHA